MHNRKTTLRPAAIVSMALVLFTGQAAANTFTVVNSGASSYVINGAANPALTLYRGRTYTFNLSASGHPFWIKTISGTGTGNAFTNGITGNGLSTGTLTFTVPTNAPSPLFYNCQFHLSMQGTLNIQDSPQVGWWGFDKLSTNVADASGRGLHAVLGDGLSSGPDDGISGFSTDVPGALIVDGTLTNGNARSYRFAKTNGSVNVIEPRRFAITNTSGRMTVEAFAKITDTNLPMRIINIFNLTNTAPDSIISPFLSPFGVPPRLAITIHSDATTNFVTTFADTSYDPAPVALNRWHHLAFVQDGQTTRFYVDYQLAGEVLISTFTPGPYTDIDSITLGGIFGQPANAFVGLLDEIRVTGDALAPSQFLRVAGGLPPDFRSIEQAGLDTRLTLITQSGLVYKVQSTTNMAATPQVWTDAGVSFTGQLFYTSVTNADTGSRNFRAIRVP